MLSSSYVAERMGVMSPEDRAKHDALCWLLLKRWPLPEPRPSVEKIMAFAMRDSKRGLASEEATEISDVMLRSIGDVVHTKTNNLSKFPSEHLYKWLYTMGFPHEGASDSIQASGGTSKDGDLLVNTVRGKCDLIGMG